MEAFFPDSDLLLDGLPFFGFDFSKHVVLYDDHFIKLVNFCVNYLVLDCFDRPKLDFVLSNLTKIEIVKQNIKWTI